MSVRNDVRDVVNREWDPLGVYVHGVRDEYDAYLPGLFRLVECGASLEAILDYLWLVETESIGLQGSWPRTKQVAGFIHELAARSTTDKSLDPEVDAEQVK